MQLRKRLRYRNNFQTYFFATLSTAPGGTRLAGRFGNRPANRYLLCAAAAFFLLFECNGLVLLLRHQREGGDLVRVVMFLLIPLGMATFFAALVAFCRYLSRNEAQQIRE